ncbi:hypothetical protein OROMI_033767 [Orobanche minor]
MWIFSFWCHYCENHTEIGFYDVFGKALKTAFEAIIREREKEMDVMLTTGRRF